MFTKNILTLLFLIIFSMPVLQAQDQADEETAYVIEYYYKIKWGYQEEFLELYKKNHYPLLREAMDSGHILDIQIESPEHHGPEDRRWDYRVTVIWESLAAMIEPYDEEALMNRLYPDREAWKKAEQRRFLLIEEHMDIPIVQVNTSDW